MMLCPTAEAPPLAGGSLPVILFSNLAEIQAVLRKVPEFAFRLAEVARFPTTAYLAPEPAEPFIALTEALVRKFPEFPPFRGEHSSIVPHLTVGSGSASEIAVIADELQATIQTVGPIHASCSSVSLFENSSGLWTEMHVFALRASRDQLFGQGANYGNHPRRR